MRYQVQDGIDPHDRPSAAGDRQVEYDPRIVMALVDPEFFDDQEVAMVYVASRLNEGKRVEQILSAQGIDYAVDVEPFDSRIFGVFVVEYEGIGFYVLASQAGFCRRVLRESGLIRGLLDEDFD